MVHPRQIVPHLQDPSFVFLGIRYFEDDVIQIPARNPGSGLGGRREVARHCRARREQIVIIGPAVIRVLLFLLQDADHEIRNTLHQHRGANCGLSGEKLAVGFRPQHQHAPAFALVIVGNQPAFGNQQ